jgi:hypothetical protein
VLDEEVRDVADTAFRGASTLIDSHRQQLDQLASRLLANEVLERQDIDEVMRDVPRAAPPRLKGVDQLGIAAASAEHPLVPRTPGA